MPDNPVQLVVFDIAGTTVRDRDEVLHCFREACRTAGITAADARLNALMGVSKLEVFHLLWREQLPEADEVEIQRRADQAFAGFRKILENYYRTHPVEPTDHALEIFAWLRARGIKIGLNTGFYRAVTDIILEKLGWAPGGVIDAVVASDEAPRGRPAPDMIRRIMEITGVDDPLRVVKIGDTPVDLQEGHAAGCRLSLGVTNGTHTREQLAAYDPDGLLPSLAELPAVLEGIR